MNVFDSDNVYGGKTIPITQLASILIMTIACILFSGILLPTIFHDSNRKVNRKSFIVIRITFRLITTSSRENLSVNQIHQNRTSPLLAGLFSRFFGVIIIELLKRAPSSNALLPSWRYNLLSNQPTLWIYIFSPRRHLNNSGRLDSSSSLCGPHRGVLTSLTQSHVFIIIDNGRTHERNGCLPSVNIWA